MPFPQQVRRCWWRNTLCSFENFAKQFLDNSLSLWTSSRKYLWWKQAATAEDASNTRTRPEQILWFHIWSWILRQNRRADEDWHHTWPKAWEANRRILEVSIDVFSFVVCFERIGFEITPELLVHGTFLLLYCFTVYYTQKLEKRLQKITKNSLKMIHSLGSFCMIFKSMGG